MDIKEIKKQEIEEIHDFLEELNDFGHIYHFPHERLDSPFKKIIEGIQEVQKLMKDSFDM